MIFEQGPSPEDSFTLISNRLAREETISLQAKGLYLFMRSHKSGWSMNVRSVAKALGVSKDTVSKLANELIDSGYIQREQAQGKSGRFGEVKYLILSTPCPKSPDTVDKDSHRPKLPDTVSPDTVNQDTKEDYSFKKTIGKEDEQETIGDSGESPQSADQQDGEPDFEDFWLRYPRKIGDKPKAKAKWREILSSGQVTQADLLLAADNYASECKQRQTAKRYIAYPITFLNQSRYLDYMEEHSVEGGSRAQQAAQMNQWIEEFVNREEEDTHDSCPF